MGRNSEESSELVEMLRESLAQAATTNAALLTRLEQMQDRADAKANEKHVDQSLDPARKRIMAVIDRERKEIETGARIVNDLGVCIPEENVECLSANGFLDESGVLHAARFTANIQRGRIVRLDNYRLPEGVYKPKSEGGICPFPRHYMFKPNTEIPTNEMALWVYNTWNKVDNSTYPMKPARAAYAIRVEAPTDVAAE